MSDNIDATKAKQMSGCLARALVILTRYGILDRDATFDAARGSMDELERVLSKKIEEIENE